jgi:hypothetical protein
MSENKVKLLKSIFEFSPTNSVIKINGFYSDFISKDSFKTIFPNLNSNDSNNRVDYDIILTNDRKKLLLQILDKEQENIVFELTHFCVLYNGTTILLSFDTMDIISIKRNHFIQIENQLDRYTDLSIEVLDEIENDFFEV